MKPPVTLVTLHTFVLTAPKLTTENSLKCFKVAKDTSIAVVQMSLWETTLRKPPTFPTS